jgi:hypothetical protein
VSVSPSQALSDDQRAALLDALCGVTPDWHRAYELRRQGVGGQELAAAFGSTQTNQARARAKAVELLLGELPEGRFRSGDNLARVLSDHLLRSGRLDPALAEHVSEVGRRAREAYESATYDNPQMRAWETVRGRAEQEAEAEAEIEDQVEEDVETTNAFQLYVWTYSGIPVVNGRVVAKIGYAGTGQTSDAWHRMVAASRTTGAPGAVTMLRVWEGTGDQGAARRAENALHENAGRRVPGGGAEWFEADVDALDRTAQQLGLERRFAVNPA